MVEISEIDNDATVDYIVGEWEKKQAEEESQKSAKANKINNGEPELPPQLAEASFIKVN